MHTKGQPERKELPHVFYALYACAYLSLKNLKVTKH